MGRFAGMDIWLAPGFPLACGVLLVVFTLLGTVLFHRSPGNALLGGVGLVLLHWVSETWHNLGHFTSARRSGFSMTGVRLERCLHPGEFPGFRGRELPAPGVQRRQHAALLVATPLGTQASAAGGSLLDCA